MIPTFQKPGQCGCADTPLQGSCQASGLGRGRCQVLLETYQPSLQSRSLSHHKMQGSQPARFHSLHGQPSLSGAVRKGSEDIYSPLLHFSYLTEPSGSCFLSSAPAGSGPAAPFRPTAQRIKSFGQALLGLGHPESGRSPSRKPGCVRW